jgi:hypothetical protein
MPPAPAEKILSLLARRNNSCAAPRFVNYWATIIQFGDLMAEGPALHKRRLGVFFFALRESLCGLVAQW